MKRRSRFSMSTGEKTVERLRAHAAGLGSVMDAVRTYQAIGGGRDPALVMHTLHVPLRHAEALSAEL